MSSLKAKRFSRTEVAHPTGTTPAEVVIGQIAGVADDGAPLVDFPGNPAAVSLRALATARYDQVPPGAAVALMFIEGDRSRPLALGLLAQQEAGSAETARSVDERLTLTATREIVLQCGRASIVLTRAGKVLVRGAYLSLRSSGMQRISGASVQIN
jgi:hypothetical protein